MSFLTKKEEACYKVVHNKLEAILFPVCKLQASKNFACTVLGMPSLFKLIIVSWVNLCDVNPY